MNNPGWAMSVTVRKPEPKAMAIVGVADGRM